MPTLRVNANNRDQFNQAMQQMLSNDESLTDVSFINLRPGDAEQLANNLSNNSTITTMSVPGSSGEQYNYLSDPDIEEEYSIGNNAAIVIFNALRTNTTLTSLKMSNHQLESNVAQSISDMLRFNSTLTKLDLQGNVLSDDGVLVISNALKNNSTLKFLELHDNQIEDITNIANALKENKGLSFLGLRFNNVNDEKAEYIIQCLSQNNTLESLDLGCNLIEVDGIAAIANNIESCKGLKEIYLDNNAVDGPIDDEVVNLINKNSSLEKIYVHENCMDEAGPLNILKALKENDNIVEFSFKNEHYIIDSAIVDQINETLRSNIDNIGINKREIMSESFLDRKLGKDIGFEVSMDIRNKDAKQFSKASAAQFFHKPENLITNDIASAANLILNEASFLSDIIRLPNNVVTMWDALNDGVPVTQITSNLKIVKENPDVLNLMRLNPKIVGHLATLGEGKLDNAVNIVRDITSILDNAGSRLGSAINLPNNVITMWDALSDGLPVTQITSNLEIIKANSNISNFVQNNPKALSYLLKLDEHRLENAGKILGNLDFIGFLSVNPKQIGNLVNIADDEEKMARASAVLKERRDLLGLGNSLKPILQASQEEFQHMMPSFVWARRDSREGLVASASNVSHSDNSDFEGGTFVERVLRGRKRVASLDIEGEEPKKLRNL